MAASGKGKGPAKRPFALSSAAVGSGALYVATSSTSQPFASAPPQSVTPTRVKRFKLVMGRSNTGPASLSTSPLDNSLSLSQQIEALSSGSDDDNNRRPSQNSRF